MFPESAHAAQLFSSRLDKEPNDNDGSREWPGLLVKLDRLDASTRE